MPSLVNRIVRDAVTSRLKTVANMSGRERKTMGSNLALILAAAATFSDLLDRSTREDLLSEIIVLGHHVDICEHDVVISDKQES